MAVTCTRAALVEDVPCLNMNTLGNSMKLYKALQVYFMAKELAAIGGTDYTSALSTTLVSDATDLFKTMSPDERLTARLSMATQAATNAGATVSSNIQTLMDEIKCLKNVPDLEACELLLLCKLGYHKHYPQ